MSRYYSPLRYPGGKTLAVNLLRPFIRPGNDLFSPFFGGGSVEFDAASRGARVYGYDTYSPLPCFYQQLKTNRDALLKATLALYPLTDDKFREIHTGVDQMPDGPDKAAAIFALNYTTYMGLMQSDSATRSQDRFNPQTIRKKLAMSMNNVTVENLDFRESFDRHKDVFAFIDPPYVMNTKSAESYYGNRGSHHRDFDHDGLFELIKDRDNWIMTHHDHSDIRERYASFPMQEATWHHSMGNKPAHELIIKSRDHAAVSRSVFSGITSKRAPATTVQPSQGLRRWMALQKQNPLALQMEKAARDIENVILGRSQIALLSGVPGVGKSHLLHNCSARMRARNIHTAFVQIGHPRDLDDAIYQAGGKNLIVIDEADRVMDSISQIGRLKLLADPKFKIPLKSGSGKNARSLLLTCPIILAFNASITSNNPAIEAQLQALYSRKRPVVISGNRQELWAYSVLIALTTNLLKNARVGNVIYDGSISSFSAAIDIFTRNIWNLNEVSPRCLQSIYNLVCQKDAGHMSSDTCSSELNALMSSGPSQHANLPPQEDWADLRRQFIAFKIAQKNGLKPTLLLPAPANNSSLAKAA